MLKQKIANVFNNRTNPEKLIILLSISLFLPFEITILYIVLLGLFVLISNLRNNSFKKLFEKTPYGWVLLILAIYFVIVSAVAGNWIGFFISFGLILIFFVYFYYRQHLNLELFNLIVDIMIFMSLISVAYSVFEQLYYAIEQGSILKYFNISNAPKYRVHAFYFNANYYALMIAMVIIMCVYKLISQKKYSHINYSMYIIAIVANLFALFLTGSRLAWMAMIVAIIVLFSFTKKWRALSITIAIVLVVIALLFLNIPIIPRFVEYGFSLESRTNIYETSFLMMKDTWLFGRGPLTYMYEWPNYVDEYVKIYGANHLPKSGLYSEHTHSIFIEPLVSFGVIGSIFFIFYLLVLYKEIFQVLFSRVNAYLCALILAITAAVLVADVIDLSVLWVQTGMLFFMIIGASSIYLDKIKEKGSNQNDRKQGH